MNVGGFQFCMFFSVLIHTAQIKHADGKQHQPCGMQNRTSAPNENIKSMDGGSQTKKNASYRVTSYSECKLNIPGQDCHSFCMDSTQVGILKQTHQICLRCLLYSLQSSALHTDFFLTLKGDCFDPEDAFKIKLLHEITDKPRKRYPTYLS